MVGALRAHYFIGFQLNSGRYVSTIPSEGSLMSLDSMLAALEQQMTHYPAHAHYQVPDIVLFNLAIDVREQCEAVRVLAVLPAARAALTNARAALESAIDGAYLTSTESEYGARGARARVFELFEGERVQRRASIIEIMTPGASPDLEHAVREDARGWSTAYPDFGKLILGAWEDFSKRPSEIGDHWSGHSRLELYRHLLGGTSDAEELIKMLDVVYALLSIAAHPRPRTGSRTLSMPAPDSLVFETKAIDGKQATDVAEFATAMILRALQRRQAFTLPDT